MKIAITFYNDDGDPCSHYNLGDEAIQLERVPIQNDDEAWRGLARWMIVNRPDALAAALGDVAEAIGKVTP